MNNGLSEHRRTARAATVALLVTGITFAAATSTASAGPSAGRRYPHGQHGHARNYAELHPIMGFRLLAGCGA